MTPKFLRKYRNRRYKANKPVSCLELLSHRKKIPLIHPHKLKIKELTDEPETPISSIESFTGKIGFSNKSFEPHQDKSPIKNINVNRHESDSNKDQGILKKFEMEGPKQIYLKRRKGPVDMVKQRSVRDSQRRGSFFNSDELGKTHTHISTSMQDTNIYSIKNKSKMLSLRQDSFAISSR